MTTIKLAALITDAYATVAIAYRRASAAYTMDEEMQQLGTAAVHLLTIATSYMAAQADEALHKSDDSSSFASSLRSIYETTT